MLKNFHAQRPVIPQGDDPNREFSVKYYNSVCPLPPLLPPTTAHHLQHNQKNKNEWKYKNSWEMSSQCVSVRLALIVWHLSGRRVQFGEGGGPAFYHISQTHGIDASVGVVR